MYTQLPKEIIDAINDAVEDGDMEYADNYRAYRHKDGLHQEDYDETYRHGCCGYFDTDFVDSHGDTWTIGCNYGH